MTTAWTKALALALVALPLACEVTVGDDTDFVDAGFGGDGGSGEGGSSMAGSAGSAGVGAGGEGGSAFPAPTCEAETGDDECTACLKQQCCTEWLACDDATCEQEWQDTAQCVSDIDFPDSDDFGMCVSLSSADESGLLQQNSTALIESCANEMTDADAGTGFTRCGEPCFGTDIFF